MNLLKTHKIVFLPAFIIGLLIVLPTISAILRMGISEFQGVYPMFSNDEDHYLAKIQDVYNGHFNSGNPFLKEYKDSPSLHPTLAETVLGGTARILRISVPALAAINDFLLPFIGVIALYAAAFVLTRSRKMAVLTPSFYYFVLIYVFNRPINPQFSFIFLFLSLFLIYKIISVEEGNSREIFKLNIWLAVVFGIEFYTYPFCWTTTLVLYSVVLFFLSIKEKRFFRWKGFLLFSAIVAVISAPYLLSLKAAVLDPSYLDSNLRYGFMDTRIPSAYFNVGLALSGLIMLFFSRKYFKDRKLFIFLSSLGLSGIILNWQNIITGKALSFSMHYYWVVVLFLFLIIAGIVNVIRKEKFSLKVFIVCALIVSSILVVLNREKEVIKFGLVGLFNLTDIETLKQRQELAPLADWFNKNTPKESVIYYLGNNNYSWFLPIYTHNYVYYNSNIGTYLMSGSEMEDRWIIQNFFVDLTADYIKSNQVGIWLNKYIEPYQNREIRKKLISFITGKEYVAGVMIPDESIQKIFDKQAAFRKLGFEIALKKYESDYVLLSKQIIDSGKIPNMESFGFLSLISRIGDNFIYKIMR